jgi:hypothetical protein
MVWSEIGQGVGVKALSNTNALICATEPGDLVCNAFACLLFRTELLHASEKEGIAEDVTSWNQIVSLHNCGRARNKSSR